jgi:predicted 3-demethylubiquinone-9 3-methyltransferase (glyoxalase superfamily)
MPIAFQWIEENYTEVYKRIPRDANHDDIGAVVAAAFSLVETMSAYQKGIQAADEYKRAVADGTWAAKTSSINPVWAKVTGKIREAKAKAFQSEKRVFKDTIT